VGRAKDDAARGEALADLQAGVTRATRLAEQLLALARSEPDGLAVSKTIDLRALLQECVVAYAPLAANRGVDLGIETSDAATVTGDADALRVMFNNLVDNATKYTPHGGRVDVSLRDEGGRPVVRIADSGPGIEPADRDRVFDRFYRAYGRGGQRIRVGNRAPYRDPAPCNRDARRIAGGWSASQCAVLKTAPFRTKTPRKTLIKRVDASQIRFR